MPKDPGHKTGHAPGFTWGDLLDELVEAHGTLTQVAWKLIEHGDDVANIERALRRLRTRGRGGDDGPGMREPLTVTSGRQHEAPVELAARPDLPRHHAQGLDPSVQFVEQPRRRVGRELGQRRRVLREPGPERGDQPLGGLLVHWRDAITR